MKKSILFLWALCTVVSVYGSKNYAGDDDKQAVDLGLSVKWASCNVGASAPERIGGYYAWGETEEKNNYSEKTYQYYANGKYTSIGTSICGTQYDVAHVKWGGQWRMPTSAEVKELNEKCTWSWITLNGVKGMKVTGPNGNSIFLPAAGFREGGVVDRAGDSGYYWSGSLGESGEEYAWNLGFDYGGYNDWPYDSRYYGFQVRSVFDNTPNNDLGGHDVKQAVDLGLSVKWGTCNVDASAPEGTGGYYAWGETEVKIYYSVETYKYYVGFQYISIDSNICGTQYDVAHVKWGGKWRMPTLVELKELVNKCTWCWTTLNGVKGMKVTGPNGNSIFLPAAGFRCRSEVYDTGDGYYWSGLLDESGKCGAWPLNFNSDGCGDWYGYGRDFGYQVRPVLENE